MQPPTPQVRRTYLCYRARSPVAIDGRLDKPVWLDAPWTDEFVDIEGDARPRPPLSTRVKMLWDDEFFYIGAELEEPHVWATLTEHDSIVFHDNDFEVFLNPTGDNHQYYEVEINALGTIFDLFLPKPYRDGGPADHGWDAAALRKAVRIDGTLNEPADTDRAWSVELAIPWRALDRHRPAAAVARPPADGEQWRVNFSRVEWDHRVVGGAAGAGGVGGRYEKIPGRPEHNWVWSPQGVIDMHRPEQWGYVQFCAGPPGRAVFKPDESLAARDALHAVYYAQRAYFDARGRWAASLDELDAAGAPAPVVRSPFVAPLVMARDADGWRAAATIRHSDGLVRRWCIRQDSLVWCEPG